MNITQKSTVAEIVSKNLGSDHVFSKYKIDFCCGGGDTLEKACKESGVDYNVLIKEIESINSTITGTLNTNYLNIDALIKQAKEKYHTSITDSIFEILPFAEKVAEVHGGKNTELVEINVLVKGIEVVISEMIKHTRKSLYPKISEFWKLNDKHNKPALELLNCLQEAIRRNEIAQQLVGDSFKEISSLSMHYTVPEGACNSYMFLYEKLHDLQHEVQNYIHFEKNVLIPKVLKEI